MGEGRKTKHLTLCWRRKSPAANQANAENVLDSQQAGGQQEDFAESLHHAALPSQAKELSFIPGTKKHYQYKHDPM